MNSESSACKPTFHGHFVFTRVDQVPRHPAQLYEALFYFGVTVVLYLVWKTKRFEHSHGFIFGLGMVLIFIQRFLVEFLKENQVSFEEHLTLNMGQTLSIPLVLVGIALMIWSQKTSRKDSTV